MHRPLLIAVLWAIALWPASLEAHFRGANHRGGFHSRSASVVIPERLAAVIFGGPATMPGVAFDRRYFRVPLAGAPYSLPPADVFQPFVYASPIYTVEPHRPIQAIPSHDSKQVNELLHEVKRLAREVQRLREEQRQSSQTPPEPPQSTEETSLPVLVFQDGRQMEVQGYAIVGQTLWAFTERSSTQIPIADLDLEATQKLNADHGVRFPLPRKP
jgi:hypothetical protein